MKIIKVIFLWVVALGLIVSAGIFIFLETFDVDAYLPRITHQVSQVLGRPTTVGHVALGLSWGGMTLDAGPLVIADDVNISQQPFVKVDRVRLGLDIASLIIHREVHITDVLLQSPEIHIILSQEGSLNVHSIGQAIRVAGNNTARPPSSAISSRVIASPEGAKQSFNGTFIKSIRIHNASISFIDQNPALPLDIWASDINANINDFSLKGVNVKGDLIITSGVIKNFNIVRTILSHALGIFLKLGPEDTIIEKAAAKFRFEDKTLFIDDGLLETNIFDLAIKGSVDGSLNTDMQTMLHLNADTSAAFVNEFSVLKFLYDDTKRIAIGAQLEGVMPHLKYKLNKDFRKKAKKALLNFLQ